MPMSNKRALVCAPRLPEFDRESGARRLFDLMTSLCEAGWCVSFATPQQDGERYAHHLRQRGIATWTGQPGELELLLSAGRFDLALLSFWHHAEPLLPLIRRLSPGTRILVDSVDLHFLREARAVFRTAAAAGPGSFLDQDYGVALARELNVYAAADGVLTVSRKEADLINDLTADPHLALVVPDCEDLAPSAVPFQRRQGILFVGNFWHRPNVDAARYLCEQIVPRIPQACLDEHPILVVGHQLDETIRALGAGLPGVRLVGWVPSLVPYLHRARVSILPLRFGAGTKRKLLQSLAAGTPAVSTRVGVEGFDLRAGEHILVADDAEDFARGIVRLLQEEPLWQRLARQGREQVLESHGPEVSHKQLLLALAALFRKEPKRATPAVVPAPGQPSALDYPKLVQRVNTFAAGALPAEARVLVVSKGDEELLRLGGRQGRHFPQLEDGTYAGYYPANDQEAITHLEALRQKGHSFLLLPATAFWWLEHYKDFHNHLLRRYVTVAREDGVGWIFDLRGGAGGNGSVVQAAAPTVGDVPALILGRRHRKKVLVVGIYLADQANAITDLVAAFADSVRYDVTQCWVALGGAPPTPEVAAVTVRSVRDRIPKYQILNEFLAGHDPRGYEYVVSTDDDIQVPGRFLDHFLALQTDLGFAIAQPARTSNSYVDHPIVEQQRGVLARQTLFVEIGPLVSFHRSAYDLVFPFDLTSQMGWGYESVWALRLSERGQKMGIIDALPIEHSMRKPVANYSWAEANSARNAYLARNRHLPLEDCYRVLDVISFEEAQPCRKP
jgi:glycosyltransferase involved in cell wall biosynthesis